MFSVLGTGSDGKTVYWDGKNFAESNENQKKYKLERSVIAVARKLRKQKDIAIEIVDNSTGKTSLLIIVSKNGGIGTTLLPKEWEDLATEGFTR